MAPAPLSHNTGRNTHARRPLPTAPHHIHTNKPTSTGNQRAREKIRQHGPVPAHLHGLPQVGPAKSRVAVELLLAQDVVHQPAGRAMGGAKRSGQTAGRLALALPEQRGLAAPTSSSPAGRRGRRDAPPRERFMHDGRHPSTGQAHRTQASADQKPRAHVLYRWCCFDVRRSRSMKPSAVSGSASSSSCCSTVAAAAPARAAS